MVGQIREAAEGRSCPGRPWWRLWLLPRVRQGAIGQREQKCRMIRRQVLKNHPTHQSTHNRRNIPTAVWRTGCIKEGWKQRGGSGICCNMQVRGDAGLDWGSHSTRGEKWPQPGRGKAMPEPTRCALKGHVTVMGTFVIIQENIHRLLPNSIQLPPSSY